GRTCWPAFSLAGGNTWSGGRGRTPADAKANCRNRPRGGKINWRPPASQAGEDARSSIFRPIFLPPVVRFLPECVSRRVVRGGRPYASGRRRTAASGCHSASYV